ncbi:restriction endonuclease subunit S [Bacillus sp. PS06]|nr:restriction endonuclease subunit S [Bacillus sp. PS06]
MYLSSASEYITEKAIEKSSAKIFPKDTVLIAMYGATIGNCSILSIDAATNQACAAFKPNEKILPEFLYYFFCSIKEELVLKGVGGAQPNISISILKNVGIPNYSINTQKEIIKLLNLNKSIIDKRKAQILALSNLTQSVFLEMFGDPVSNEKNWKELKLSEAGDLKRGLSKHRPRNAPELLNGPYPLIQTGNIGKQNLFISKYNQTYSEFGLKQSKLWPKGTLCITIAANIAQTGILSFDACFPDSVVAFIPKIKISNIYVHYWFTFFQKIIEANAPESAQKNINLKILGELVINVPPIDFQTKFENIVSKIEYEKKQLQDSLLQLETSYNALLKLAFNGEIFND